MVTPKCLPYVASLRIINHSFDETIQEAINTTRANLRGATLRCMELITN